MCPVRGRTGECFDALISVHLTRVVNVTEVLLPPVPDCHLQVVPTRTETLPRQTEIHRLHIGAVLFEFGAIRKALNELQRIEEVPLEPHRIGRGELTRLLMSATALGTGKRVVSRNSDSQTGGRAQT